MNQGRRVFQNLKHFLRSPERSTEGVQAVQPPSPLTDACPIINIPPPHSPTVGRPFVLAKIVPSLDRPGQLSLRMPDEQLGTSWRRFFEAMSAAGFKAGDVVTIERAF